MRAKVASNINTPPDILQKLAGDKSNIVLEFLAMNPKISTEIAMNLLQSNEAIILNTLILATIDPKIAKYLLDNPKLIEKAVREYRFHPSVAEETINENIALYSDSLRAIVTGK